MATKDFVITDCSCSKYLLSNRKDGYAREHQRNFGDKILRRLHNFSKL